MPPPFASRIVTCFHQWDFLRQWVDDDALFPDDIEWGVVNDAPADPPPPALAARLAGRRFRVLTAGLNLGRSRARNFGAGQATGRWLDFIDGDDRPLPLARGPWADADHGIVNFQVRLATAGRTLFSGAVHAPVTARSQWAPLLPAYTPVDVTPAALLWRRESFLALQGFDGRFEGAEDFHLVFCAMTTGVPLFREATPKQCYFERDGPHTFLSSHIEGHRRLLEWIAAQDDGRLAAEARFWLGKELLYECGLNLRRLWRHRRLVGRYLASRLRTRR